MMKISSVMSRDVQVCAPDAALRDAAALMKRIDVGVLPVAEGDRLSPTATSPSVASPRAKAPRARCAMR